MKFQAFKSLAKISTQKSTCRVLCGDNHMHNYNVINYKPDNGIMVTKDVDGWLRCAYSICVKTADGYYHGLVSKQHYE